MAKGAWAWLEISAKLMLECVTAGNRELKLSEQDSEVLRFVLQENNYGSMCRLQGVRLKTGMTSQRQLQQSPGENGT